MDARAVPRQSALEYLSHPYAPNMLFAISTRGNEYEREHVPYVAKRMNPPAIVVLPRPIARELVHPAFDRSHQFIEVPPPPSLDNEEQRTPDRHKQCHEDCSEKRIQRIHFPRASRAMYCAYGSNTRVSYQIRVTMTTGRYDESPSLRSDACVLHEPVYRPRHACFDRSLCPHRCAANIAVQGCRYRRVV